MLVVEDDEDARSLLSRVLTAAEARVCEVEDVRAALDALDSFQPNLVVSDIGIPGEDGYDLIRADSRPWLRCGASPRHRVDRVARSEDRERAMQAGYSAIWPSRWTSVSWSGRRRA